MDNLVVAVLGHRNSGKSTTWYSLFGRTVRTGTELKRLYLTADEYVDVFLVSGSPEERETYVGDIIGTQRPRIVLCSMQYRHDVTTTINFFIENSYFIFCHWLNPGYSDQSNSKVYDELGLVNYILSKDSVIGIRNGKTDPNERVRELKDYIYGWAKSRGLIKT
ncbi:MAG: hypothetical protein ACK47E_01565 [Cyclobacteriaceae bacterium]